ncbi:unnamed protein product [Toxocara canis]|uniref:Uncharacterized protein n=1 Tax=Toxocara canis TaxID=6265 RepID=A0A183TV69_TOXCA|nr:unnamed protein product [Toxocara canis]
MQLARQPERSELKAVELFSQSNVTLQHSWSVSQSNVTSQHNRSVSQSNFASQHLPHQNESLDHRWRGRSGCQFRRGSSTSSVTGVAVGFVDRRSGGWAMFDGSGGSEGCRSLGLAGIVAGVVK